MTIKEMKKALDDNGYVYNRELSDEEVIREYNNMIDELGMEDEINNSSMTEMTNILIKHVNSKNLCFTGRRPKDLFGYDHDAYIPMVEAIKKILREEFIPQGYNKFISGGAQGFDQLAFWAVNALKREGYDIKNVVYVPFRGQERAWKDTGLFSQKEYNLMLRLANEVIYLKENLYSRSDIVKALYDRNHAMVDNSEAVFGLYPDYCWALPETKGGTAECLKYAQQRGKKIYQLSNETLRGQWISI